MAFAALALILSLAWGVRTWDLSRAAVRSDEINFLMYASRNQSLVELWKDPPWLNQIPLADSIPILWTRLVGRTPDEASIRQPFAILGWMTVAFCSFWIMRRKGIGAGLLLGLWMSLLPYHVYHSREAYYYVVSMFFSAGMCLRGADFVAVRKSNRTLRPREYLEWGVWALLACMSHMSTWVVAGMVWVWLLLSGMKQNTRDSLRSHLMAMGGLTLALGVGMSRWVWRAIQLSSLVSEGELSYVGSDYLWVGLRVLPVFMGGANAVGLSLLIGVAILSVWLFWKQAAASSQHDPLYPVLTGIVVSSLVGTFAYILFTGGDKAKLTYFAANLPAVLAWAVMTLDRAFGLAGKWRRTLDTGMALLIAALLAVPAWQVVRLDGKPTAYRLIRDELDRVLSAGDVAIVDRWWEPWNEMAFYAPSNVFVSFTVPDEPYEQYVGGQWRRVTRDLFERNGAQAFIRLHRNHEQRQGLWTWPETHFRRRTVVTNAAARWLRDTGFAPMEEYYTEHNRVETEIFYDTRADIAEKARAAGRPLVWFFDRGWQLYKPWQQGDFNDYRLLEREAVLEVHNLRGTPVRVRGEMVATASGGRPVVRIGSAEPLAMAPGALAAHTFELDLAPGVNRVPWRLLAGEGVVVVGDLRLHAVP